MLFYKNELLAEEIKQNYDTFDYNVSSLMKKKHVSIKRNIKSAFYKSAFYKSAFYKSAFYKSAFCKSSPVQSSPRNTVCRKIYRARQKSEEVAPARKAPQNGFFRSLRERKIPIG